MNLLISGGGFKENNHMLNRFFVEKINHGRILYIPQAGDETKRSHQQSYLYVKEMFEELGAEQVDLCETLENLPQIVNQYDGIYFSGGSMARLLSLIEKYDLKSVLRKFADEKLIFGQSAGAMIFGADLSYYPECNGIVPLNFIPYGIVCHYKEEMKKEVSAGIAEQTICIPDNAGVYFTGTEYEVVAGEITVL